MAGKSGGGRQKRLHFGAAGIGFMAFAGEMAEWLKAALC